MKLKGQTKILLATTLISLILVGVAVGLLVTEWNIQSIVSVKGIKLGVYEWVDDTPTKGAVKSDHGWGSLAPGESKVSENLVIESEAVGMNMELSFSHSLDSAIGSVTWKIEFWDGYNYVVYDYPNKLNQPITIQGTDYYLPGSTQNPVKPGQQIGFRPPSVSVKTGDTGHLWMEITIKPDATMGQFEFGITVVGTEVA